MKPINRIESQFKTIKANIYTVNSIKINKRNENKHIIITCFALIFNAFNNSIDSFD